MECKVNKEVKITICFSEEEARWLRSFIQNYPMGGRDNLEVSADKQNRAKLFEILSKVLA